MSEGDHEKTDCFTHTPNKPIHTNPNVQTNTHTRTNCHHHHPPPILLLPFVVAASRVHFPLLHYHYHHTTLESCCAMRTNALKREPPANSERWPVRSVSVPLAGAHTPNGLAESETESTLVMLCVRCCRRSRSHTSEHALFRFALAHSDSERRRTTTQSRQASTVGKKHTERHTEHTYSTVYTPHRA